MDDNRYNVKDVHELLKRLIDFKSSKAKLPHPAELITLRAVFIII
jgi:hypothetical protein